MISKTRQRVLMYFALSTLLAACSGGGSQDSTDQAPIDLGQVNAIEAITSNTVIGRVADGYIRGATVCVDINENDACDSDEPFAITGAGGLYELAIPEDAEAMPIVADIPAEAIDEDTGESVGEALVFITPANRPEFISPITTLVYQELRVNPALEVDEAEQIIQSALGIDGNGVSLFADYVEQSDPETNQDGTANRFIYLHSTARVVASIMKDLESQVESAAVSNGVDVISDQPTRLAIQNIVLNEIREILPQIGQQVSDLIGDENNDFTELSIESFDSTGFNPDELAVSLRPTVETDNVVDRIESTVEQEEFVESDLRQSLSDGIYWINFNCDEYSSASSVTGVGGAGHNVDALDAPLALFSQCAPTYGRAQLSDDGSELFTEEYSYNSVSRTWEVLNEEVGGSVHYTLVGGEWVSGGANDSNDQIEFLSQNSALITQDVGTLELDSATQTLDGRLVQYHLRTDGVDEHWFDLVEDDDIFSSGAQLYKLTVSTHGAQYVLYNEPSVSVSENSCAAYDNNCNVVHSLVDGQKTLASSLSQVLNDSIVGVPLTLESLFGDNALITLNAEIESDGSSPTAGIALIDFTSQTVTDSISYEAYGECVTSWIDSIDTDTTNYVEPPSLFSPGEFAGTRDELAALIGDGGLSEEELQLLASLVDANGEDIANAIGDAEYDHDCDFLIDTPVADLSLSDDSSGGGYINYSEYEHLVGSVFESDWTLIEVDGVEIIEIQLPLAMRYDGEHGQLQTLLLAEQNGFLRVGARLSEENIESVVTYNEIAFSTLSSILESRY